MKEYLEDTESFKKNANKNKKFSYKSPKKKIKHREKQRAKKYI
jgi:hypothetical protein